MQFKQNSATAMCQTVTDGAWLSMALLKRGQKRHALLKTEIGSEFRPIKAAKKRDLEVLLQYVHGGVRDSKLFRSIASAENVEDFVEDYEA